MSYFELENKGAREDADNIVGVANPLNSGRTSTYNKFYEIEPAVVTKVDTKDEIGKITCVPYSNPKEITAYPLNNHIQVFPVVNEVILFVQYKTDFVSGKRNYYIQTIDFKNNVSVNDVSEDTKSRLRNGNVKIGNTFGKYYRKTSATKLLPFEGDVILQGRFGQSIRFGESLSNTINFSDNIHEELIRKANWMYGAEQGNPITIISNGRRLTNGFASLEDVNSDDGIVFMSSDSTVPFIPGNKEAPLTYAEAFETAPNEYSGNQVIVASDRLIFNSRQREMLFFSNQSISFSTSDSIFAKAKNDIHFEFDRRAQLGTKAENPVVLGNELVTVVKEMLDIIDGIFCGPYNVMPDTQSKTRVLRNKLQNILSQKVYTE